MERLRLVPVRAIALAIVERSEKRFVEPEREQRLARIANGCIATVRNPPATPRGGDGPPDQTPGPVFWTPRTPPRGVGCPGWRVQKMMDALVITISVHKSSCVSRSAVYLEEWLQPESSLTNNLSRARARSSCEVNDSFVFSNENSGLRRRRNSARARVVAPGRVMWRDRRTYTVKMQLNCKAYLRNNQTIVSMNWESARVAARTYSALSQQKLTGSPSRRLHQKLWVCVRAARRARTRRTSFDHTKARGFIVATRVQASWKRIADITPAFPNQNIARMRA